MANMSYVRFENTLRDLRDCEKSLHDKLSEGEAEARQDLVLRCRSILLKVGFTVEGAPKLLQDLRDAAQNGDTDGDEG